jgi:hypothetical protein
MLDVSLAEGPSRLPGAGHTGISVLNSPSTNNVQAIPPTCNAPVTLFECKAFPAAAPKSQNQKPTLLPMLLPKILSSLWRISFPLSECAELLQIAKKPHSDWGTSRDARSGASTRTNSLVMMCSW